MYTLSKKNCLFIGMIKGENNSFSPNAIQVHTGNKLKIEYNTVLADFICVNYVGDIPIGGMVYKKHNVTITNTEKIVSVSKKSGDILDITMPVAQTLNVPILTNIETTS